MNHLELFSGTFSFSKVSSTMGYSVVSLDRDIGRECPLKSGYLSEHHIKEDIMLWDYTQYPPQHFHLITASPVCTWWSKVRASNIGRRIKGSSACYTREQMENDIITMGVPMVDRVFEILDYFRPVFYIIENPQTGRMKDYINDLIPFYDVDYCQYSKWGYRKRTRLWTNIQGFHPKTCVCTGHKNHACSSEGGGNNRLPRYRIPFKSIRELLTHVKNT